MWPFQFSSVVFSPVINTSQVVQTCVLMHVVHENPVCTHKIDRVSLHSDHSKLIMTPWDGVLCLFHFISNPIHHLILSLEVRVVPCSQLGGCYPAEFFLRGYRSTLKAAQAQLVVSACLF